MSHHRIFEQRGRVKASMLVWLGLPVAIAASFIALSQTSPPAIPAVSLSPEPLYASGTRAKPTLTLALSVEFPTVGAQYVNTPNTNTDNSYAPTTEYIGYFDAESCYSYVNDADPNLRRFDRTGPATNRTCGGTGFSGNFMNWATSSAVDVLRLGLTGGDRIVDTASLTVLQRAVLPDGRFYNDNNFPSKRLSANLVAGALPSNLRGTYTGDVYVANCFNRVHFGTAATGSCSAPGNNSNLGIAAAQAVGPITSFTSLPSGFTTTCGSRGQTCNFSGTLEVAYGRGTNWKVAPAYNGVLCSESVFTGGPNNNNSTCYTRPYTGTWTPPGASNGTTALSRDNFFYSRVKVCESSGSTLLDPRTDYCLRYPNGNFKPVGNLQKFSDRVRVAAFGYLLDNQQSRYGGVLRAPMKFVGPRTFDADGVLSAAANPGLEWSESTGVFVTNPLAAAEGKSGVVNYLNQFGRTGTAQGTYKTFDPVGELYYEALRYIQGLAPTPQAISGLTAAIDDPLKDGFPVYSTWTDPHETGSSTGDYSCLKNNILLIGDVNTHNDKSIPGNTTRLADSEFSRTASVANNEPDFTAWTRVVDSFETNNNGVTYTNGQGTFSARNINIAASNNLRGLQTLDTGATRASFYMAGMAYWANTNDIRGTNWSNTAKRRPGMRATTYVLDVNEFAQQSVTATRRNSQFFLTAKYGGFKDRSNRGNPFLANDLTTDNSNWEKPNEPGEARTYFLSSSARGVLTALDGIFATIAAEGNSIAGGAISTQSLATNAGFIYQAQFDSSDWSGDLISYPIAANAAGVVTIGDISMAQWRAASRLDAKLPASRNIVVGRTTPVSGSAATPFVWGSIESSLTTALNKATPTSTADAMGQARLNFIRGDRSMEGAPFRRRGNVLGDIINSAVAYSGEPTNSISDPDYRTFATTNANRVKALYVGANDGMLHAFNSANGEELFGYIPSWLGPKLPALTATTYNVSGHQSYADGSPEVAEAKVGNEWKTVLVSGTGGGGQGVFALDVTNPSTFDASKVMWEFTDRDDRDLGNVVGKPQILKLRTSAPNVAPVYKWFAVVPGGVNNYLNDGNFSTTGTPTLFILDLSKPVSTAWSLGTNYFKVSIPLVNATSSSVAPGVINFTATAGLADEVEYIYAGDLYGNLWKFDFTLHGTAEWNFNELNGRTNRPLFIARDASSRIQPISVQPNVVRAPNNASLVLFGTGKYFEPTDNVVNASIATQSFYSIYDNNSTATDTSGGVSVISGRTRLQAGTATSSTVTIPAFVYGRPRTNGDLTQRSGWYFDFPRSGERLISSASLFGNAVLFGSVTPPETQAGSCGTGSGNQYNVNIATGNGNLQGSQIGILGEPLVFELASSVSGVDSTGRRIKTEKAVAVFQGSGDGTGGPGLRAVPGQITNSMQVGRLSWRQITNYQELKNKTFP